MKRICPNCHSRKNKSYYIRHKKRCLQGTSEQLDHFSRSKSGGENEYKTAQKKKIKG